MPIDSNYLNYSNAEAGRIEEEAKRKRLEIDLANANDIKNQIIRRLKKQLEDTEARLEDVESELMIYKAQDAAFLAEVRALIEESKSCPSGHHHILHVKDENGQSPLKGIFDEVYAKTWHELRDQPMGENA